MAKRERVSQADKIDYIVSRGIEKRKAFKDAKPAYIDRFYREAKYSEASGETFDRYRARGHPPKVEYHAPNARMRGKLGTLDQYSVGTGPKGKAAGSPASIRDIPKLRTKVGEVGRYYIAFSGKYKIPEGTVRHRPDESKPLSTIVYKANLDDLLADSENIVDFANKLFDDNPHWTEVYTVYMREAV